MPKLDMARLTHENASLGATFITDLSSTNLAGSAIVDGDVQHEPDDFFTFSIKATVGTQKRFLSGSFVYSNLEDSASAADSTYFVFPGTNVDVGFLKNPDGRIIAEFGNGISGSTAGFVPYDGNNAQATAVSVEAETGSGTGLIVLGHQVSSGQITSITWGPPPGSGRGFAIGDIIRIWQGRAAFGDEAPSATYTLGSFDVNVDNEGNLDNLSGLTLSPDSVTTFYLHRARPIYDS